MTTSDKLREFADKWGFSQDKTEEGFLIDNDRTKQCLSDLTALISEHYVPKDDYDKLGRLMDQLAEADEKQTSDLLRQRDELREALLEARKIMYEDLLYDGLNSKIEAVIKSTER